MKGNIWTVAIVAVLAGVIFLGVGVQFESAEALVDVEDEEHTLSDTDPIVLEGAEEWNQMDTDETVTLVETGDTLERGDDYTIDYDAGEITGTPDNDGEDVFVNYSYQKPDEETDVIAGLLAPLSPVVGLLLAIVALGTLLSWVGLFGRGGGR